MSNEQYESIALPGAGEVRARRGTSTLELAGAAKFWHDRYSVAKREGMIVGISAVLIAEVFTAVGYFVFKLI